MTALRSLFIRLIMDSASTRRSDGEKHQQALAKQTPKGRRSEKAQIYRKKLLMGCPGA